MNGIDCNSSKAIYKQLIDMFIENIETGIWPVHSKILSEKEICEKYGVSRITARKTIDELAKAGLVEKVQGKGTFIKDKKRYEQKLSNVYRFRDNLSKQGVETIVDMKDFTIIQADDKLSAIFQIKTGSDIFRIERLFFSHDKPYAKEISYIPRELCRGLNEDQVKRDGLYKSLNSYDIFPDKAIEQLRVAHMTESLSKEMKREKGDAYIGLDRTTFDNDVVVEYTTSCVCGDMFEYTVELYK